MKQYITLKQWDEITKEQKNILWDKGFKKDWQMSIGQMIEFLGYAWWEKLFKIEYSAFKDYIDTKYGDYGRQELCDALWDNCKLKLKKICLKK